MTLLCTTEHLALGIDHPLTSLTITWKLLTNQSDDTGWFFFDIHMASKQMRFVSSLIRHVSQFPVVILYFLSMIFVAIDAGSSPQPIGPTADLLA
jgi:hypothetical protein